MVHTRQQATSGVLPSESSAEGNFPKIRFYQVSQLKEALKEWATYMSQADIIIFFEEGGKSPGTFMSCFIFTETNQWKSSYSSQNKSSYPRWSPQHLPLPCFGTSSLLPLWAKLFLKASFRSHHFRELLFWTEEWCLSCLPWIPVILITWYLCILFLY